ncbi:MAG: hypothetical protein ACRDTA_19900 [Pseudonocardiaceae bacterium]
MPFPAVSGHPQHPPLDPGLGCTLDRWAALARLARTDLDTARLAEADLDARTIMGELEGPAPDAGQRWGVWAAEPPDGIVHATPGPDGSWRLRGTKRWCSGAGSCSHVLISARYGHERWLFALDLEQPAVRPRLGEWVGLGMAGSSTGSVELHDAVGWPVGAPGAYLNRPGFWHGAIGVAACWYGGAVGVTIPLWDAVATGRADQHTLAHLGAVDTALAAARALLRCAAHEIDHPGVTGDAVTGDTAAWNIGVSRRRALRVRAAVEHAATTAIERVGRALGPGPLAHLPGHAQRVADLGVYLRQSHAERDLAELGVLSASDHADLA